ncbi:hypothetical protein [Piscinibacter gummiphilus]|uniref:Uncharacterized protein n=1 Tax=Piscinibacter gummiphilus TaxID=946333 RepID=A0ABZ0CYY8_9BURK|nr:hypothetical protein [Piscinibacter gummiphilus]WOB08250.1 hypothetical protein RXV79_25540 [Piscinibacter gummiphilus]
MSTIGKRLLQLGIAVLATSASVSALAQTAFTSSYRGGTSSLCTSSYTITGYEPSTSGKYPVYIHTVGTGEDYNSELTMTQVKAMAAKGFVAASVEYASGSFGSCSTIGAKARCIFNGSNSNSAIAKLCARAKADCSKGVVTGGLSQGSIVSVLSRNYDSRIRASYGQGTGTNYSIYNLSSCMNNGGHTQAADRIRIVNGESDSFVGPTASNVRTASQAITGLSCGSSALSCFRSNGSGWYIVKGAEVEDGSADHCYMLVGGCTARTLDNGFKTGSAAWQMDANQNWLKSFVTP